MAKAQTATKTETQTTFKRTAAVSVASISLAKMEQGDSFFFQPISAIYDKADTDKKGVQKIDPDSNEPQFLHILRVVDLTTGEIGEIVLGHIINKDLRAIVNDDGEPAYIAQKYEMLKGEKKGRTNMWSLFTVE